MKIGKIIKDERLKRDLTQEQLAQEFFVTRQLVSKWENGKSYPDLDQVVKMSEWFELPLDYLLKEDTKMLDELNFDTKLKKRIKLTSIILGLVLVGVMLGGFIFFVLIDQPFLQASDIEITKVEKIRLPKETIVNSETNETWTLPEDVEYKIHFKTAKPFVNLTKYTGFVNISNDYSLQILLGGGNWSLVGGKKESIIYIQSERKNLTTPRLNNGKDIYLMSRRKVDSESLEQLELWSDKILDWNELKNLPNNH